MTLVNTPNKETSLVNTPANNQNLVFPGGPPSKLPPDSVKGEKVNENKKENVKEVKSDVSGIGWKEIVLTRDDFERLSYRPLSGAVEEKNDEFVFVFIFPMLYFMLMFKDDIQLPENIQGVLKVLLFMVTVYYIMHDNTLKRMRVNTTYRLLIGFSFGGLLVASSSVV